MRGFLALLGSADGPRLDLLAQAARALGQASGGVIRDNSEAYIERANETIKGGFANAVVLIESASVPDKDQVRRIESALGRVRDPERNIPHTVDIDILMSIDERDEVALNPKKDLGGEYALYGAWEIAHEPVRAAVRALMTERDIDDAGVRRFFYPIASRGLFARLIHDD